MDGIKKQERFAKITKMFKEKKRKRNSIQVMNPKQFVSLIKKDIRKSLEPTIEQEMDEEHSSGSPSENKKEI